MAPQRRRIRVLLADDGRLLHAGGALPAIDVELRPRETTSAAAWRVLPDVALAGPLLDCYVDQSGVAADDHGEIYAALVELDGAPPGWSPPTDWAWRPLTGPPPDVEPGLRDALAARLAELRGDTAVHPGRMPWARPGWFERAASWIDAALRASGRSASTSIVQSRHWGISAVMAVESPEGRWWFKAASGPFRHEAAVTAFLHRAQPDVITPVLAVDVDEGWLLLDDIEGDVVGEDPAPTAAAFERLLDLQLALVGRTADLLAAGCPHRPLGALARGVDVALASPLLQDTLALPAARIDQLVETLHDATASVAAIGVPDTFVHGDFHPGNVITSPHGITIFDWSDAAVSNPVVDVATWASWFTDDADRVDSVYRTFHDVRAARLGHPAGHELDGVDRGTLAAVAGGYHLLSYAGLLADLEPHRRLEHLGGITDFFALLDAAAGS